MAQLSILLVTILLPVVACVAVGLVIARRQMAYPTQTIGWLVLTAGAPCLVVNHLARLAIDAGTLLRLSAAALTVLVVYTVVFSLILLVLRLDRRTFLAPLVFANCGNLGLPLSLFAFGPQAFGESVIIFALWTIAKFLTAELYWGGRARLGPVLKSPLTWAGPLGLAFALGHVPMPASLANATALIGGLTIPMMLVTLGVALRGLEVDDLRQGLLLSLLRVGAGGLLAWAVARLFHVDATARSLLVLHGAMPTAVLNYMFAVRHERQPERVASFVLVSTGFSAATLPVLLWCIRAGG